MRIAIFGGAFNPPHNGHLTVISQLLNSQRFDRIIVVPSGKRPDKEEVVHAGERLHMVKLACADGFPEDNRIMVFGGQCDGTVEYGTIDLVRALTVEMPKDELFVIIGEELAADLPNWKESETLAAQVNFMVLNRPGVSARPYPENFKIQNLVLDPLSKVLVSSSYIRESIAARRSVAGLVPSVIAQYILLRNLYQKDG